MFVCIAMRKQFLSSTMDRNRDEYTYVAVEPINEQCAPFTQTQTYTAIHSHIQHPIITYFILCI